MAVKIPAAIYDGIPAQFLSTDTINNANINWAAPSAIGTTTPQNGTFLSVISSFGVFDDTGLFGFNAVGTNVVANTISFFPGVSTGNALGGDTVFGSSTAGSSGAALQARANRMRLKGRGALLLGTDTDNGADLFQCAASGRFAGVLRAAANSVSTSTTSGGLLVSNGLGVVGQVTAATGRFISTVRISSATFSIQSAVPASPVIGDQWQEVNGSNQPLYGWFWTWNGTYWLSPDMETNLDFRGVATESAAYFHCSALFNYFFKSLNISHLSTTTQDGANNWSTMINRKNAAATNTAIGTISSNGNAANTWVRQTLAINTHVSVSGTATIAFEFRVTPSGVAGSLNSGVQAVYNLARL